MQLLKIIFLMKHLVQPHHHQHQCQQFTTYIEEHADACLASKQDPTIVTIFDSDDSDSLDSIDDPELTTNLDVKELTRESICSAFDVDRQSKLQLKIRRRFCFDDFIKCFSKKWNANKKKCLYSVTFIGESGLDTGGVSREFYSGSCYNSYLYLN